MRRRVLDFSTIFSVMNMTSCFAPRQSAPVAPTSAPCAAAATKIPILVVGSAKGRQKRTVLARMETIGPSVQGKALLMRKLRLRHFDRERKKKRGGGGPSASQTSHICRAAEEDVWTAESVVSPSSPLFSMVADDHQGPPPGVLPVPNTVARNATERQTLTGLYQQRPRGGPCEQHVSFGPSSRFHVP